METTNRWTSLRRLPHSTTVILSPSFSLYLSILFSEYGFLSRSDVRFAQLSRTTWSRLREVRDLQARKNERVNSWNSVITRKKRRNVTRAPYSTRDFSISNHTQGRTWFSEKADQEDEPRERGEATLAPRRPHSDRPLGVERTPSSSSSFGWQVAVQTGFS